jgi:CRISPR-associated endonuclease/helicase Cas3
MRPERWPDEIEQEIWAKSADKGEGGQPESLAQHTWLVLSRLADFIRLRPNLPAQLGQSSLWHCLYWGTFLHDFGKAMPGFQGVLRGDKMLKAEWGGHRHEVFSLAFLGWVTDGLSETEQLWCAAAIAAHHKDPADLWDAYPLPDFDEPDVLLEPLNGIPEDHLAGLHRWLGICGWGWSQNLGLDTLGVRPLTFCEQIETPFTPWAARQIRKRLAAFSRLQDTLRRERKVEILVPLLALRGYIINADHGGSAHVEQMPAVRFTKQDVIEKRNIKPENLFLHQVESGQVKGSALLIAPTGSGKTEAALLWVSQQDNAPRLFYTLPYQASMNAMNLRLGEIYGNNNVGLQHGRGLSALYRQLMERNYSPEDAARTARQMKNLAKLNDHPVRVFSPYQMLKAMYRLKGYEAQLSDYHNALFIFDEIHAYEVGRLAMILKTINYLREYYNAKFFVMSATFPTLIKSWLKDVLGNPTEITAKASLYQEFQRHELQVVEGDLLSENYLKQIANEAKEGKSILVVCNVVARAQQAYETLNSELQGVVPVELLHGRFNMQDRMGKEKNIREKTGTNSDKRSSVVLVATQVVEVSLDIDLNTIYTDPAPLEALIQRFGRINRGRKMEFLAQVHVFTKPDDGQKIYDPELISRTLQILRRENGKPIDESKVGIWLDEIYKDEIAEQWQKEFIKASNEFESVCVNTLRPFGTADDGLEDQFGKMFDGIEVLPNDLYDEYDKKKADEPIAANDLLVPMRWGQYHMLLKKGLMKPGDKTMPPVAMSSYSSEIGLTFERKPKNDDWD